MASLNKVLLMGNLTRDPDERWTGGGSAICGLGLAVNRRFTTANGEDREEVCFVDIDVFGKQAESCSQHLHKGSPVLIEGRLRLDQWEDRKTKEKRSRLKVVAERVHFMAQANGRRGPEEERRPFPEDAQATPAGNNGGAPENPMPF